MKKEEECAAVVRSSLLQFLPCFFFFCLLSLYLFFNREDLRSTKKTVHGNSIIFIRFYTLLYAFIRFYTLLYAFIRFYTLLYAFICFYIFYIFYFLSLTLTHSHSRSLFLALSRLSERKKYIYYLLFCFVKASHLSSFLFLIFSFSFFLSLFFFLFFSFSFFLLGVQT